MKKYISILALLLPLNANSENSIAVVDLRFLKDTGETAAIMCYGEEPEDCSVWATLYLFEARTREHIAGEVVEEKFNVLFGRHALRKSNINKVVAKIERIENNKNAKYIIKEVGIKEKVYCFSAEENKMYSTRENSNSGDLECYEEKF